MSVFKLYCKTVMASEEIITKISSSLMYSPLRPRDFIILFVQYYSRICCPSDHTMGRPYSPKIEPGWSINVGTLTTRSPLLLFSQMSLWIYVLNLTVHLLPLTYPIFARVDPNLDQQWSWIGFQFGSGSGSTSHNTTAFKRITLSWKVFSCTKQQQNWFIFERFFYR